MKVALIAPPVFAITEEMGYGFESVLIGLTRELASYCDVTLFAPRGSFVDGLRIVETVEPTDDWGSEQAHYDAYAKVLGDFDVIHSMDHSGFVFKYLETDPDARIVHTFNGMQTWEKLPEGKNVRFVVLSQFQLKDMRKRYEYDGEYALVAGGVDTDLFAYRQEKEDYILHFGLIAPHKGHQITINIADATGIRFIIAGEDRFVADKAYVEWVKENASAVKVEYLGPVSWQEKIELMQRATAVFLPFQVGEADSLIAKEALSCGTPVITSNNGAMPEIISHKRDGFLCGSVDAFLEAVENDDPIDPRTCRNKGTRYSLAHVAEEYARVYRSLMPNRVLEIERGTIDLLAATGDDLFDVVSIRDTFEHVKLDSAERMLESVHNLLFRKGKLEVNVVDFRARVKELADKSTWNESDVERVLGFESGYSPEMLCRVVAQAGFESVQWSTTESDIVVTAIRR